MSTIILASASPRRHDILKQLGITFNVIPSSFHEVLDNSKPTTIVAQELAYGKAAIVAKQYPDAYVIGADTIVSINGKQLGKPTNITAARMMLRSLAGSIHTVTTAVVILHTNKGVLLQGVDTTRVYFKSDSPRIHELRETYLRTNDWRDKAGGYGIQSGAATLIEKIDGEYTTVVGLPMPLTATLLHQAGITVIPTKAQLAFSASQ